MLFSRLPKKACKRASKRADGSQIFSDIFSLEQKAEINSAIDKLKATITEYLPGMKIDLERYKNTVLKFCKV